MKPTLVLLLVASLLTLSPAGLQAKNAPQFDGLTYTANAAPTPFELDEFKAEVAAYLHKYHHCDIPKRWYTWFRTAKKPWIKSVEYNTGNLRCAKSVIVTIVFTCECIKTFGYNRVTDVTGLDEAPTDHYYEVRKGKWVDFTETLTVTLRKRKITGTLKWVKEIEKIDKVVRSVGYAYHPKDDKALDLSWQE